MSIPKLLALDIKYNISEKELEKTVSLRLNINKDKFNQINVSRREKNMSEITLDQVQKLVVKGKAVCGFCRGDVAAMANKADLKSLEVYEEATGNTLYWQPGMKSLKKAK